MGEIIQKESERNKPYICIYNVYQGVRNGLNLFSVFTTRENIILPRSEYPSEICLDCSG